MLNKVKVIADLKRGCYTVMGLYHGDVYSLYKPIRGIERNGIYKANYSARLMRMRRKQILEDLNRIKRKNPDFNFSKKDIRNVDPLMYKSLEDWDAMNATHYAMDYLKTVVQSIDGQSINDDEKEIRAENLKKSGIDITYNIGLLKTSKKISMMDKLKGMLIARKQKNILNANVNSSLVMSERNYEEDKNAFKENKDEEIFEFGNHNTEKDNDFLSKVKEELVELKTLPLGAQIERNARVTWDNLVPAEKYEEEDPDVKNFMERIKVAQEIEERKAEEVKPAVQTVETKKAEEVKPAVQVAEAKKEEAKKEVQTSKTKKKKERPVTQTIQKEAKSKIKRPNHERKSFYEMQMDINEKNALETAKTKIAHAERIEREAKEEEEKRKLIEDRRLEKEKIARMGAEEKARAERIAKLLIKSEENAKKMRAEAEAREYAKKLEEEAKAKEELQLKRRELANGIKEKVGHWTRKINNAKESIKNMHYQPSKKFRRAIALGAVTLMAATSLSPAMKADITIQSFNKNNISNDIETKESTNTIDEQETKTKLDFVIPEIQSVQEKEETKIETIVTQKMPETIETIKQDKEPEKIVQENTIKEKEKEKVASPVVEAQKTQKADKVEKTKTSNTDTTDKEEILQKRIEKFREYATQKYMESIIVGETPKSKDILMNQAYSERPDGTGNIAFIGGNLDYHTEYITVVTNKGWDVIDTEGKSLKDVLDEYKEQGIEVKSWNFLISTEKNNLGFITGDEYESIIENNINNIVNSYMARNNHIEAEER